MSKINDLIKEMCPNGVKFYKLSDIGEQFNGLSGKSKKDFENGNYKYITYTNIYNNPSTNLEVEDYVQVDKNEKQNEIRFKDILIAGSSENLEDSGMISVVTKEPEDKIYLNSFCFGLRLKTDFFGKFNANFIKHLFRDNNFRNEIVACSFGVTRYNLSKEKFLKIKIPCPPLEVQEEIVRVLDKFGELETELEAELEARKSQYEFWHGKEFDNIDAKFVKLSDLCKIGDGLHGTPRYLDDGDYYFINGNNLMNGKIIFDEKTKKVSKTEFENQNIKLDKNTLLMSINGTIGKVSYYDDEKIMLGKSVAYFGILDEKVLSKKYLFYLLQAPRSVRYYNDSLTGSTILNLGLKALREFEIPLPPIEEQNKISNILEHFDKLINDITVGIPAEIELRRKQYEYYRNKLLTFEEI